MSYFSFGRGSFGKWKNGSFLAEKQVFSKAISPKTLQNRKNHEKIKQKNFE